jgi:tetraacyldisaccharide 4'-kinase
MSFNFYLLKGFRLLLFPFSLVVALGIIIRNKFYDWKWIRSTSFNLPIVCIGNLSAGGTGKSPMAELLISFTKSHFKVATLSRGYKRKTRGYLLADENTTALEIGDEPMQFHLKHPDIAVAVGEERIMAIPQLLHDRPDTQLILLDDAFQHRAIQAGLNIILTDYSNPYWYDWFLPSGDLRDQKSSANRADIIVVTKCPPDMEEEKRQTILRQISPHAKQQVFFATLQYGLPYHILTRNSIDLRPDIDVLLVCGIANPAPLKQYIEINSAWYQLISYADHHIFTIDDLRHIRERFEQIEGKHKIILTTEKDAVRLVKFGLQLNELPLYIIPVKHHLLFGEEEKFKQQIIGFVSSFHNKATA